MIRYLFILLTLSTSFINVYSQIKFHGNCLYFESNLPIKSKISLNGKNGNTYMTITNNSGYFKFDSIACGSYRISIFAFEWFHNFLDTIRITNPQGEPFIGKVKGIYCSSIKENYIIDTTINQKIYMLYTADGILHGDGFPRMRRLFRIIPIPFLVVSFSTYEVIGGSVERYSKYIGEKRTTNAILKRLRLWTHSAYNSFHDIYIKPEESDTIHYNCIGGTLHWID